MRSKSYCIPVNPISWKKGFSTAQKLFDNQSRDHITFHLSLENIHGPEPIFSGSVKLECCFYIRHGKNRPVVKDQHHIYSPPISDLYKFLIEGLKGIVISEEKIICELLMSKAYDTNPRTEFTITEVC